MLASLNHPNIAAIHGFEDSTELQALVLELVEGPTLAERLAHGPIPLDEVLPIACQICDALEAAHEQGIIHRNLKPANIKVRPDGTVKVLDFGLAKALEPLAAGGADGVSSPTITSPALTRMGIILGTAAYMSPEQAKGRPADKRSDIWAFGCVFYEMVTGRRAFQGEEVTDTLASVLKSDPDWGALLALPSSIRSLIEGCLKKDRRDRIGDISTVRFLLNQPATGAQSVKAGRPHRRSFWKPLAVLTAGALIGGAAVAGVSTLQRSPPVQVTRFSFALPVGQGFNVVRPAVAISPDGTRIAYAADDRLYLRTMSELQARPIAGTEFAVMPVFSPDSQSLVFWVDSTLKRIAVSGGVPVTICRTGTAPSSVSWEDSGILFTQAGVGIMRVSPNGGKPDVLVAINPSDGFAHGARMLPDGNSLLFTLTTDTGIGSSYERWNAARVVVQSLKTGKRQILFEPGTDARYIDTGHIVYAVGDTLFARTFNAATLEVTGGPMPVVEEMRRVLSVDSGAAQFSFSRSGSLVYLPGGTTTAVRQLFLFNRKGVGEALKLAPGSYSYPRVSPDGKRLVFQSSSGNDSFISIYDLSGTGAARRLTFGGNSRFPVWSADSKSVVFQSDRGGHVGVFRQSIDGGGAEPLTKPDPGTSHVPEAWSPDGNFLLFNVAYVANRNATALWILSASDGKTRPFGDVTSTLLPTNAVFSPDGRWVAYQSGGSGTGEGTVFVEPFPPNGTKHQIAQGGRPLWSHDGKELFFVPAPGQLRVVSVTTKPTFTFTDPIALPRGFGVSGPLSPREFDMTPQGLIIGGGNPTQAGGGSITASEVRVVVNWFEEVKARAPAR